MQAAVDDSTVHGRLADIQGLVPPYQKYAECTQGMGQLVELEGGDHLTRGPPSPALYDHPRRLEDDEKFGKVICFALILNVLSRIVGEQATLGYFPHPRGEEAEARRAGNVFSIIHRSLEACVENESQLCVNVQGWVRLLVASSSSCKRGIVSIPLIYQILVFL